METEVTEAGSQPVAVVVQEDSAGDSDDEEDRGDFHSPRGLGFGFGFEKRAD